MASVTIALFSLSLLLVVLVCLAPMSQAVPAPYNNDDRLVVPVHHGGEPVVATNRRGQRNGYDTQGYYSQVANQEGDNLLVYVLPALAITGLSLLFPNIVTVNTGRRRRRDIAGSEAPIDELSEHMMNIFYAAMESDECLQRIACEVGAASRSFKSGNIASLVSALGAKAPTKYGKLFEKFKFGMNAEKCEALGCSLLDQ